MALMKIDYGMLMSAVSTATEEHCGFREKGFLNRRTGEIVFVPENEGAADAWYGSGAAIDLVFDRAAVEANPSDWIEIPKYREWHQNTIEKAEAEEQFAYSFLTQNGVDANVV